MLEKIESRRQELGMTVKQLSDISGIPEGTYNNIIKGRSKNPSYETIRCLCMALQLSMNELATPPEDGRPLKKIDLPAITESATQADLSDMTDILVRLLDTKDETYAQHIKSRNEEFEKALESKDKQYETERQYRINHYRDELSAQATMYKGELAARDKWMKLMFWLLVVFIMVSMVFVAELILDRFFLAEYGRFRW